MLSGVITVKLNDLLKKKGKSLYWLQKETGISYNALLKIRDSEVESMSFVVLEKICEKLDCMPNDLLAIEK